MTHRDLILIGLHWMSRAKYDIFDLECGHFKFSNLIPDLVGMRLRKSLSEIKPESKEYSLTVIEVKTSRSDWRSGSQKYKERCSERGMYGDFNYLLCPAGMLKKEEIHPLWGLITVAIDGRVRVFKRAKRTPQENFLKQAIWEILLDYSRLGMYYRWEEVGVNYQSKGNIIPGSELDKVMWKIGKSNKDFKEIICTTSGVRSEKIIAQCPRCRRVGEFRSNITLKDILECEHCGRKLRIRIEKSSGQKQEKENLKNDNSSR